MLREIVPARQFPGEPRRRWFADVEIDLITWHDADGRLVGFQLCYDRPGTERAITWRVEYGFSHAAIDSGDALPDANRTPILVPDGAFDPAAVRDRFRQSSATIDPDLRDAILARLAAYAG